jgi:hypothetical protein
LTNTPIPPPDFEITTFAVGSAPFIASGHLDVGEGVDFVAVASLWRPGAITIRPTVRQSSRRLVPLALSSALGFFVTAGTTTQLPEHP